MLCVLQHVQGKRQYNCLLNRMVVCLQVKAKADFERILEYSRALDHLYPINTLYLFLPFAHYIPGLWLHATKKKISPNPTLQIWGVLYIKCWPMQFDSSKNIEKWPLLAYFLLWMCWFDAFLNISLSKKHFHQELRYLGLFYFVSFTGNLGPSRAKSLQNGGLSFLPSRRKKWAGNHPQSGFPSDGYEHNLSGKHVLDWF